MRARRMVNDAVADRKSVLHGLDPRVKVCATLVLVMALIAARTWLGNAILLGSVVLFAYMGNLPPQRLVRAVRGIIILLIFTFVLNALFTPGEPLIQVGPVQLTEEGIARGALFAFRLIVLVALTTILTATTAPMALADGMQFLLSPLKLIGIPTSELALITSIALRFVPILLQEARRIHIAQYARGIDTGVTAPLRRVTSIGSVLVPLFAGTLRRADELGDALEARGFRPGAKRGSLRPRKIQHNDLIAIAVCGMIVLIALVF